LRRTLRRGLGRATRCFTLARLCFALLLFGDATRIFGGLLLAVGFFLDAAAILRLHALVFAALGFEPLRLGAHGFIGLAALRVDLILLLTRLLLQHVALDVRLFLTHLDVDGARTPLRARELDLLLGLAAEGDLVGRAAFLPAAVAAAQVCEQLELRIVADARVRAVHLDAGLVELHEQSIHRHLQDFRELRNCYVCHLNSTPASVTRTAPTLTDPPRTNARGLS